MSETTRTESGLKRVRAFRKGEAVADTRTPLLVWEKPYYPTYYFPEADVQIQRLDGVSLRRLASHVTFPWDSVDAWFEEDEEVFTHARDPYTRVDILQSSRHVRVVHAGVTLAESTAPRILFETHLPPRVYLPKPHVRMDLLVPTATITHCPYKGQAAYWSLEIDGKVARHDVAWSYRSPFPESQKIAGLVSFYPGKVELYVDDARWT